MKKKMVLIVVLLILVSVILIQIVSNKMNKREQEIKRKYDIKGVDVSSYQGEINWDVLSKQDIKFAFIKATEGSSYVDEKFSQNLENAKKTDLKVGAYHFFSYDSEGKTQADNFIKNVPKDDNMLPPVVDIEFYGDKEINPPEEKTTRDQLKTLIEQLEKYYEKEPIIYATQSSYKKYIANNFDNYIWIRDVYSTPKLEDNKEWKFWQFTDKARLSGYKGKEKYIDMNVFNGYSLNEFIENTYRLNKENYEEINRSILYKDGKLYINKGKIKKPEEIPIYLENIKEKFSNPKTYITVADNIYFVYNKDDKVNITYKGEEGQWQTSSIDTNLEAIGIYQADENGMYVCLKDGEKMIIYYSNDKMKTWEIVSKNELDANSRFEYMGNNIVYVEKLNGTGLVSEDGGRTYKEIISMSKADDIADNEAKKEKYQYHGWKSEFYSRDESYETTGDLILGLDKISKLYHWRNDWQIKEYENKLMWKISLFDKNDPVTSLYIYIDAIDGSIVGAGSASD